MASSRSVVKAGGRAALPPTRGTTELRSLWNRVGVFRVLATFLLVLGVVGGVALGVDRNSQRDATAGNADGPVERVVVDDALAFEQAQAQDYAEAQARDEAAAKAKQAAEEAAAKARAAAEAARKAEAASRSEARTAPSASPAPKVAVPSSCAAYTGNKGIGCALVLQNGWGLDQMGCLDKLWMKESGWRTTAKNPSGAYGIPQALPGSKMSIYGSDWQTNPSTQIKWGLSYIKSRYGSPCSAWSHSQSTGWY